MTATNPTFAFLMVCGVLLAQAPQNQNTNAAKTRVYNSHQKAFYAATSSVEFVRPGLVIKILSAQVAADGTISTSYTASDPQGLPLDSLGVTTPGLLTIRFIAAYLPKGQEQYTAYTTRVSTGIVLPSTVQAGVDSGGPQPRWPTASTNTHSKRKRLPASTPR